MMLVQNKNEQSLPILVVLMERFGLRDNPALLLLFDTSCLGSDGGGGGSMA
jgi:hypothetical protein